MTTVPAMTRKQILTTENILLYLISMLLAVGLKYHYSTASSDDLAWILSPTAAAVELLSGIEFQVEARTGFTNWQHGMIIAKACAGINFLIIAFCLAIFSRLHLCLDFREKIKLILQSLLFTFLLTVAVNALRITAAIYIRSMDISWRWLTPERLHRLMGTAIFFIALCLFYLGLQHFDRQRRGRRSFLVPLGFYLSITLIIPLLTGLFRKNSPHFLEHSLSTLIIPALIILPLSLFNSLKKVKKRQT